MVPIVTTYSPPTVITSYPSFTSTTISSPSINKVTSSLFSTTSPPVTTSSPNLLSTVITSPASSIMPSTANTSTLPTMTVCQTLHQLFVILPCGRSLSISVESSALVVDLFDLVYERQGIPSSLLSAHFQNVEMRRGRKLTSHPIRQGSCIYLRLSLYGGSDHIDQPLPGTSNKPGLTESQRVGTTTAYSRATRHRLSSETLVRGTPHTTARIHSRNLQEHITAGSKRLSRSPVTPRSRSTPPRLPISIGGPQPVFHVPMEPSSCFTIGANTGNW